MPIIIDWRDIQRFMRVAHIVPCPFSIDPQQNSVKIAIRARAHWSLFLGVSFVWFGNEKTIRRLCSAKVLQHGKVDTLDT